MTEVTVSRYVRPGRDPYLVINLALASVILLVFIYSGIFSPGKNNYPVVCIHEKVTGQPCISCGLSHSFSLLLRGRIAEARAWNSHGPRIFIFFAAQLVMRILFSAFRVKYLATGKKLIIYDIVGSTVLFLVAFSPFLINIFSSSGIHLQ